MHMNGMAWDVYFIFALLSLSTRRVWNGSRRGARRNGKRLRTTRHDIDTDRQRMRRYPLGYSLFDVKSVTASNICSVMFVVLFVREDPPLPLCWLFEDCVYFPILLMGSIRLSCRWLLVVLLLLRGVVSCFTRPGRWFCLKVDTTCALR